MDHLSNIDPAAIELGTKLAEVAVRNTATSIFSKIRAVKTRKDNQATVDELEEIIRDLISDRNELIQIAQGFEEQLVAQRITDEDIAYINQNVVPLLERLVQQTAESDPDAAAKLEQGLEVLKPLLSVEMLTVLQVVGFNFKKALGEPLTLALQRLITSRLPLAQQETVERSNLVTKLNTELMRIAQDPDATERWEQIRDDWNSKRDARQRTFYED